MRGRIRKYGGVAEGFSTTRSLDFGSPMSNCRTLSEDAAVASVSKIRSLSIMKSSDSTFGYTRREAFRLGMSSLAAMWFGSPVVSALSQTTIDPAPTGPYTLPPLPYPYEALEPQIDTLTMQIHHDKHHKAYVDNANKLLADQPELAKTFAGGIAQESEQGSGRLSAPVCATMWAVMSITRCFGR